MLFMKKLQFGIPKPSTAAANEVLNICPRTPASLIMTEVNLNPI